VRSGATSGVRRGSALVIRDARGLRVVAYIGIVLAAVGVGGCGDDEIEDTAAQQPRTVTVTQTVREPPRTQPRVAREPRFRSCDANIRVRIATTTCKFAQNVFYEVWTSGAMAPDTAYISAYSPATGREYDMSCPLNGGTVVCRGGDGSVVRFPEAALDAYGPGQARDYECAHEVSADDVSGCLEDPDVEPYAPRSNSSDCDPNYAGECLDPNAYDYDCEGGEGDGPDYTGYVEVVGDDVHDLDRDGDGIACDW
jgi:hypothetical protein